MLLFSGLVQFDQRLSMETLSLTRGVPIAVSAIERGAG
jgi:hypothetical protein